MIFIFLGSKAIFKKTKKRLLAFHVVWLLKYILNNFYKNLSYSTPGLKKMQAPFSIVKKN